LSVPFDCYVDATKARSSVIVIAVQPNVSANPGRSASETAELVNRHLTMSSDALRARDSTHTINNADSSINNDVLHARDKNQDAASQRRFLHQTPEIPTQQTPALTSDMRQSSPPSRVVIWPESPMNFTYAQDARFREIVSRFAREHRTSVLFNSLEPASAGGVYNSAVLINEEGRLVAQYDKIRLLPFGEYVPLPRWLPVAWLFSGIVGDFTPGEKYPLMSLGQNDETVRTGVFICFESAFPLIARAFAHEGADVLVNISNDGYLGRTPVMRQHLANVIFRAVETNRPVLRVTNTGITAFITPHGKVREATEGFEPAVRTWTISRDASGKTFYTKYGDVFAALCVVISLLIIMTTLKRRESNLSLP
jgi:apolipoprotein N-acyltransferase